MTKWWNENKRWWWADGSTGQVWPCEIIRASVFPGQFQIRLTSPHHDGEEIVAGRASLYDSDFKRPR